MEYGVNSLNTREVLVNGDPSLNEKNRLGLILMAFELIPIVQDVQGSVYGQQKLQFRPDQYEYCEHHCDPRQPSGGSAIGEQDLNKTLLLSFVLTFLYSLE